MSTPSSSPSATSTPSNHVAITSSLLFGFIVSALSILVIFMAFAVVWNRLAARRRAIDSMLATDSPSNPWQIHRPKMWDAWAMPHEQLSSWPDIKPVAARKCDRPTSTPGTTQTERTVSLWGVGMWNRVPPEISYLFHRPKSHPSFSDTLSPAELSHGSDVQVLLLISMPRAPQRGRQGAYVDRPRCPEMAFATTRVPYHDFGP